MTPASAPPPVADGAAAGPARRFRVEHRTTYQYGAAVASGQTLAHLVVRDTPRQRVVESDVTTSPEADVRHDHFDLFGNQVTYLAFERAHDELELLATSTVDVRPGRQPLDAGPSWEDVPGLLADDRSADGLLARQCTTGSNLVRPTRQLREFAQPSFPAGVALWDAIVDLNHRIATTFTFVPGATDVTTPLAIVLEDRRGVCQDFAHLMVGGLRSLGLPARYVSGYLETLPPPGETKLVGADATHAWVSVWLPGSGWFDLDPTNDLVELDHHVTTAWGRDYADVAPVRGVVFGSVTSQQLTVSVDVSTVR
jgi:transglutaminase-like putative cysteine protease